MMWRGTFFAIGLILAGSVLAQPWQWQRFDGNYLHPTEFPPCLGTLGYQNPAAVGDFNGDGRDDFFTLSYYGFSVSMRDADTSRFHWTSDTTHQEILDPFSCHGITAVNLDQDSAKELIIFSDSFEGGVSAWKFHGAHPMRLRWQDDLLWGWHFPPNTWTAIFGDYDSDGHLDGVFLIVPPAQTTACEMYSRNTSGEWIYDSTLSVRNPQVLFDGDFDHDRDTDFAVIGDEAVVYENTGDGIRQPIVTGLDLLGPMGGDLDGDGQWEGLFSENDRAEYTAEEYEPDAEHFLRKVGFRNLAELYGPIIGNFRTGGVQCVAAVQNFSSSSNNPMSDNRMVVRTPFGWLEPPNGITLHLSIADVSSMADVDGDGLKDLLMQAYDIPEIGMQPHWWLWHNIGTEQSDSFALVPGAFSARWLNNSDTVFSSPQIGDMLGDGHIELAVLAKPSGQAAQVLFYAMDGQFFDAGFMGMPELGAGLPEGFSQLRLADIDGDGRCELFCKDTLNWHSFFLRNGVWQEYANILPVSSSWSLSFADIDNDGDLDVIANGEAWLNLTPSGVGSQSNSFPKTFSVSAYPNPFNLTTTIRFELAQTGDVSLKIYDLLGQEVQSLASGRFEAGVHNLTWDASGVAGGLYFVRVQAEKNFRVQKLFLLK